MLQARVFPKINRVPMISTRWYSRLLQSLPAAASRRRQARNAARAFESLESRIMLSSTFYVDDNLVITNDVGPTGLSAGDEVTFAFGESGQTTGLIFGTNAFNSIQTAINTAAAGDTIMVAAGTYTELLTVNKSVTLSGANAGLTANGAANRALRGAESIINTGVYPNPAGVVVTASGVTIDGFSLLGSGLAAGEVAHVQVSAPNFTFRNNISNSQLNDPFQPGFQNAVGLVTAFGSNYNNLVIEGSFFARQRNGVFLNPSNLVTSITVSDTDFASRTGINSDVGPWNSGLVYTLSGNRFGLSTVDSLPFGPVTAVNVGEVVSGMTVNFTNNLIASNYAGVQLQDVKSGGNVSFTGNTFADHTNAAAGLRINAAVGANLSFSGNLYTNALYVVNRGPGGFSIAADSVDLGSGSVALASASLANLFSTADRVIDRIDVGSFGQVRLKANNVYVTTNSFAPSVPYAAYISSFTTTPSIQRAIDAATAGDTVNVAAGTYLVEPTGTPANGLVINKALTISGAGQDQTIFLRTGTPGTEHRMISLNTGGITLQNLTLGGWQTPDPGRGYHVWFTNSANSTLNNVHFTGEVRVAVNLQGGVNATGVTITNSRFTGVYNRGTIRGGSEGMTITHNSFEERHRFNTHDVLSEWYSSIFMEYTGNVSGVISHNYFASGVAGTGFAAPLGVDGAFNITNWRPVGAAGLTISHNTFDAVAAASLSSFGYETSGFYSDPALPAAGPITVIDNIFRGYEYIGTQPDNVPQLRPGLGVFGGALEFDGVNDYATFNFGANELGDRGTLSFWVKMDNVSKRNQFFEGPGNGGFEVQFRTNSGGQFYGRTTTVGGDFVIRSGSDGASALGNWVNLQVIWDFDGLPAADGGGRMRIYRDGVESSYLANFTPTDLTWAAVVSTVNGVMNVGRDPGDPARFFDGLMDDVAWYDVVLDAAERATIRTGGIAAGTTTPVASWNFDDAAPGPGNTLAGNNGTSIPLQLGGTKQSSAIVSSPGTVVSYNLFFGNDQNFNPAVTDGGNNITADPLFLGAGSFVNGVDVPSVFYAIPLGSPGYQTASDATNRGAYQDASPLGVLLTAGNSSIDENGGETTIIATLTALSAVDVTVNLTFSGTATLNLDYTRTGTTIVIPAGQLSASVTVTALNDLIAEGAETIVVDIASVVNAVEVGVQQATVTIVDDEQAGFLVSITGADTVVNEKGTTDTFTVRLASQPLSNVVLNITSTNTAEGTVGPATLTFTPSNWSIPQTVTVTGAADGIIDGDRFFDVIVSVNQSLSNALFHSAADVAVSVLNKDVDGVVRYDFNRVAGANAVDHQSVLLTSAYNPTAGFGWNNVVSLEAFDTGAGSTTDLQRDSHFFRSGSRTFRVDRPNGFYEVTVVIGSMVHLFRNQGVTINGIDLGLITTNPGQFFTHTQLVEVVDGKVEITISKLGGTIVGIAGLTISALTDNPYLVASEGAMEYTFGSPATPIDPGLLVSDPNDTELVGATVRIIAGLVPSQDSLVFVDQLGISGSYNSATGVLTLTGLASVADYQTALRSVAYFNSNSNPTQLTKTVLFEAEDADGNKGSIARDVRLRDPNGPSQFRFDFGQTVNATEAGYNNILPSTIYTASTGFGWLDNSNIETRQLAGPSALLRDFHFFRTGSRTFRTDVANGEYDVTVYIGSYEHSFVKEGVLINGVQVDQLTTAIGAFEIRTYRVIVTTGRIDLTIEKQGGTFVGIAGLDIDKVV